MSSIKGKNILVVDDEPFLRETIAEHLSLLGANALQAKDGVEALEQLSKASMDVIISDIRMPNFDGIELCKNIQSSSHFSKKPVVILCTGLGEVSPEALNSLNIVEAIVTKPFAMKDLVKLVESKV